MLDAESAERVTEYLNNLAVKERYKKDIALSLITECYGRMWEAERYLYQASVEYSKLTKGDE